jgi:diguanylate cyclase (GGDEF)-like protein
MERKGAKILIVDDEMVNIKVLIATLDGYECAIAKNGEKALQLVEASPPDLILLDVMMPEMDGYEVLHQLKENKKTSHIPVIFITAKGQANDETKGLEMGAVDYIAKPFTPSIVQARVAVHTELKKQRDLLERLNVTDQLTGISNRRCFDQTLAYEWQSSMRSQIPFSLILIDVDNFKQVNDQSGHVYGDSCLQQVAKLLARRVKRSNDLVARFGGEEFVALLPATPISEAISMAESMRAGVEQANIRHPSGGVLTISLGVVNVIPQHSYDSAEKALEGADQKLYEAKGSGRNRVCY